jgi:hypothetical protein
MTAWETWYDRSADEVGSAALLWVDDRSPDGIAEVDAMLAHVDVGRLATGTILDLLNATFPLRECFAPGITARTAFVLRCEDVLSVRIGTERAERLMKLRR